MLTSEERKYYGNLRRKEKVSLATTTDNPEILEFLTRGHEFDVKVAIAKNAATSPETLTSLAHDKDTCWISVRIAVAQNHNVPIETLKWLYQMDILQICDAIEEAWDKETIARIRKYHPHR